MPLNRLINWLYPDDEEEEYETQEEQRPTPAPTQEAPPKRPSRGPLTLRGQSDGGMEIRHPRTLDERNAIGMDLIQRRMVTLDLTKLPDADARYFLEFIYGVVFALDATIQKVTDGIFLLAPHGIPVRNDTEIAEDEEVAPQPTSARPSARERQESFWHA